MKLSFGLKGPIGPAALDEQPPWLLHYRSSKWFILLTVTMAVFTDIFLYAVIVPVVPFALRTRAHIQDENVQSWVSILIAVYGGALAVFSPICGWIADHTSSRRMPLVIGLLALGAATIMLNLGSNITVLILGRVLQGLSAAVVWCVGLALLSDTVDQSEIGQTMGYVFSAMSIAILAGPLLGGIVFEKGSYNYVYAMCYVIIGVDIALRFLMIEKKVAKRWEKSEQQAEAVETSIIKNEDKSEPNSPTQHNEEIMRSRAPTTESKPDTLSSAPYSLPQSCTPTFDSSAPLRGPKRHLPPMLTLLKSRRLLCALWGCMTISTLMTQFDSVLPLYVKQIFNWNSLGAGLIFVPLIIPSFFSPLIGWAIDKYGPRWFAVAGFILFVPFEVLLRLVDHDSLRQKVLLCSLLVCIGFALNLAMPPIMVEITYVVEQKQKQTPGLFGERGAYAQAYGLFNFAWAAGCLIGPLWAGFVRQRAGWGTMGWTFAILALVTSVPQGIWTGGSIFSKRKRRENILSDQRREVEMEGRAEGQGADENV